MRYFFLFVILIISYPDFCHSEVVNIDEYEKICSQIGYLPKQLKMIRVRKFLEDNAIKTIDRKLVVDGLNKLSIHGVLIPLRESDNVSCWVLEDGKICYASKSLPYNKMLPISTLKLISKIHKQFPDIKFLIGDWPQYSTTPILCVCFESHEPIYINSEPRHEH